MTSEMTFYSWLWDSMTGLDPWPYGPVVIALAILAVFYLADLWPDR